MWFCMRVIYIYRFKLYATRKDGPTIPHNTYGPGIHLI